MIRNILINILFLGSFFCNAHLASAQQENLQHKLIAAKVDTMLNQAVSLGEHVGVAAGIYMDGKIVYADGSGWRDRETKAEANGQMLHRIASISKPMTAIAVMQLYEQGKIKLDDPIRKYVPEFPAKPEGEITIEQVLTHTSGIAHYRGTLSSVSFKEYPNLMAALNKVKNRKLVGIPGEVYQYTTYGYLLLGVLIEKVSGMVFGAYMKKHVWEPSGMMATSLERKKESFDNKSALYQLKNNGKLKKDWKTNISIKYPGGGMQSTAEELLLFGKAILENRLIKKETLEIMLQDPGVRERGNPYAKGWFLYAKDDPERGRIIGHSGSQSGTSSQLMILLDKGIVVANISNTRNTWNLLFRMAWQLIDLSLDENLTENSIPPVVDLSVHELDRFTGSYDFGKDQILKITRKGNLLYSQMNKNPRLRLYPESTEKVYYRLFDASFDFDFDEQGQVTKTTYVQNGKAIYPKKIR